MKTCLILVAGGKGVRSGAVLPKQYQRVAGKSIFARAIENAAACAAIDIILPVIGAEHVVLYEAMLTELRPPTLEKLAKPVFGGETRQSSTQNGLNAVSQAVTHVLVHDCARPFLPAKVVDDLLAVVAPGTGALPVLEIPDSVKRVAGVMVVDDPDRTNLVRAQTPQAFMRDDLLAVFDSTTDDQFTDEASAARRAGLAIRTVHGDPNLFKITHPEDFHLAKTTVHAALMDIRVGQGFDVHAFEAGDHVTVCGVDVPHTHRLKGHSDADVGLHALTDAIFGALAEGDIGTHFPPSDPQWKGAASHIFLEYAADMVRQRGGVIAHVDITIMCEQPKIGPHRKAMEAAVAGWLKIEETRVSVKATTTEKLGFTGRQEGMAAQAVATLRLP
ncbi:MAG: bifunctional 2-C-methyl-D-erythritol 4-phosphate cytidylyltransferase/2-C-methyl-D-erythritol 2,4-cyclodiphosphate synthase [Pseudomonadota bacterium]